MEQIRILVVKEDAMGSTPFSLGPKDWEKIAIGAALAAFGGVSVYVTGTLLPLLQAHEQNDYDKLIYAIVAAGAPIAAQIVRKFLSNTTGVQ